MLRIKTSFATFALATNEKSIKAKQNIKIRSGFLFRGDLQKCLACQGIATISHGKITSFYPKIETYPHLANCRNK